MTVTTDTSKVELEEAMAHVLASLRRLPSHWSDKRAALHAELDELLEEWQRAGV